MILFFQSSFYLTLQGTRTLCLFTVQGLVWIVLNCRTSNRVLLYVPGPKDLTLSVTDLDDTHWKLCLLVHDINTLYGCQLFTAMVCIFTHLVTSPYNLFLTVSNLDVQGNSTYVFIHIAWTCLFIGILFILVVPCTMAVNEVSSFYSDLHERNSFFVRNLSLLYKFIFSPYLISCKRKIIIKQVIPKTMLYL